LDLSSLSGLVQGSESGSILTPGSPDESLLYEMMHSGLMPPDEKQMPTAGEIATVRRWIEAGAKAAREEALAGEGELTQHDVTPILQLRCTVCHGSQRQEGGLDLRSRAAMLRGGESGPAIVPGKPGESLLLQRIEAEQMPPRQKLISAGVRPVEKAELEVLASWIAAGAPLSDIEPDVATSEPDPLISEADRQFWSFQPPQRPDVNQVRRTVTKGQLIESDIDAFLLRKLEQNGLTFSPPADKVTLIRRVAFDLTGLPPSWDDVQRYLNDESPDAYARMVDRYLASPRYGERWGQYWLDLAGYSDSEGKRSADTIRPHAWRYRDYVIRAFNADKPYDRFLLEQIAGDELADYESARTMTREMMDNLVATGFLRMAPDGTNSDVVNTPLERMEVIADEIHILTSGVMGLTVKCAQCHSHKYDPIPQRDYYRLVAVFQGAYDLFDWLKPADPSVTKRSKLFGGRTLPYVTGPIKTAWESEKKSLREQITSARAKLAAEYKHVAAEHQAKVLDTLPGVLQADLLAMLDTPAAKRDEVQQYLAEKFQRELRPDNKALAKVYPELAKLESATEKKVKVLEEKIPAPPQIRALWDRGEPSPAYIFRRGEITNPGRLVGPGVPSVLTDGRTPLEIKPPWPGSKKTGRRLALARWLVDPRHPLTARVMVNRIWRYHFGRGIVSSLGDFGATGTPPTHPELLDYLATEFAGRGWSIKQMHRLMLNSTAYKQASGLTELLDRVDPENKLVSRMPLARMEAEIVRDSMLLVAGRLYEKPFGKPDPVEVRDDGLVTSEELPQGWRRSIYVLHRRKEMPTILETFDRPQMMPNCIARPNSTVASQALHLMNNAMVRKLSAAFARRLRDEAGDDLRDQIMHAYHLALSRDPSEEELAVSYATVQQLIRAWQVELAAASGDEPSPDSPGTAVKGERERPTAKQDAQARQHALATFCHALLNSAAFLYID